MPSMSMKELLEAGVHFGHQTKRWNPKMKDYIFGERNGIYILDLQKTLRLFKEALKFATQLGAEGKTVLFVGTKRQAQEVVAEEAKRAGMFFVNQRWLGGILTNFVTIQKSIGRYKDLTTMVEDGSAGDLSKKALSRLNKERLRLDKNLSGIQEMGRLPDAIFVIDANREEIAVNEARKLGIPVMAVVDTNSNPDVVDYVIPGNDDALRAIKLFTSRIADALLAGQQMRKVEPKTPTNGESSEKNDIDVAATAPVSVLTDPPTNAEPNQPLDAAEKSEPSEETTETLQPNAMATDTADHSETKPSVETEAAQASSKNS